eukprot:jgi/Chlat1/4539/Chrsp29S04452
MAMGDHHGQGDSASASAPGPVPAPLPPRPAGAGEEIDGDGDGDGVGDSSAITAEYANMHGAEKDDNMFFSEGGPVFRAKYGFRDSRTITQAFVEGRKTEIRNFLSNPPKARVLRVLNACFPFTRWLPYYNWQIFSADLLAGLTVGCMLIPQSISYASIAGLPAQYGLYSGFSAPYIYALIGTSRQLAVGPVALISLLVNDAIANQAEPLSQRAIELAIFITMASGVIVLVMGLLKLGFLLNFLGQAVVTGFISATACIIIAQQAGNALGYKLPRSELIHQNLRYIFRDIDKINWPTFGIFLFFFLLLLSFKFVGRRFRRAKYLPYVGPLLCIIASTLFVVITKVNNHGVKVVGEIPKGAPPLSTSYWSLSNLDNGLWRHIIIIALLGNIESIVIGKKLATQHRYDLSHNHELVGLGAANVFAAIFSSYPVTGSFSRSAVNNAVGAKTQLAGVITATMILFVMLFLTPLFKKTPQAVLAAIIVNAVIGLIDFHEWKFFYEVSKRDVLLALVTFALTAFMGIEWGVGMGVGLSLLFVLYESGHPHTAVLGRLPGSTIYRNVRQYPEAKTQEGIIIVRIDAPIYFANVHYLKDHIHKLEIETARAAGHVVHVDQNIFKRYKRLTDNTRPVEPTPRQNSITDTPPPRLKFIILDLTPVPSIDTAGVNAISELNEEYKHRQVQVVLVNPTRTVIGFLEKTGVLDLIGREWVFVRVHDAVLACGAEMRLYHSSTAPDSPDSIDVRITAPSHTQPRPDNQIRVGSVTYSEDAKAL